MATLPVYIYGDTANDILNVARSRVRDLMLTAQGFPGGADPGEQFTEVGGGTTAVELNPDGSLILRTQIVFNAAYRKFQKYLSNIGYRLLIADNFVISSIPANAQADPTIQSWISWNGFFNGTAFASTPILPLDFYAPLRIQERIHGATGNGYFFQPMTVALEGLRNKFARTTLNRQWEWRSNALYLPGASGMTDLQFRYTRRLPDLPDPNYYVANTPWYNQQLPIPDSLSPLAWFVAHEVLLLRADDVSAAGAQLALTNGMDEADQIFNDQARADQRPKNIAEGVARTGKSGGPGSAGPQ